MKRLLLLVSVLLAACGGTTVSTSLPVLTPEPGQTGGAATGAPGVATGGPPAASAGAPSAATGVTIPAACAAGFTDYLKKIEPAVAAFDPGTDTFADLQAFEEAERLVSLDLMSSGGATYSCSEVGLEFAYFDARSPWPAIYEIANAQAPGTVAYLQATEALAALDTATFETYGAMNCEDASKQVKDGVAKFTGAGTASARDVPFEVGIALLGLYKAYLHSVADGTCPDVLGNDEFGFFGAVG